MNETKDEMLETYGWSTHEDLFGGYVYENVPEATDFINIIYEGGCFGNFLRFFIDKFSKLTPEINKNPFTTQGTAHSLTEDDYSGRVIREHMRFVYTNKGKKDLPVCITLPFQKDKITNHTLVYLKSAQLYRCSEPSFIVDIDHLWQQTKESIEVKHSLDAPLNLDEHGIDPGTKSLVNYKEKICELYNLPKDIKHIPKFIVRDWYKKDFLNNLETTYEYKHFNLMKNHPFWKEQNMYHFPLECFFDSQYFMKEMRLMDTHFNLELDFERKQEMGQIFEKHLKLDQHRMKVITAVKLIEDLDKNIDIPELDVVTEAYIYAQCEKMFDYVQMPLVNNFFTNTREIIEYAKHYPQHYKAMNPNLPKFNGIDNPYYLYKDKK